MTRINLVPPRELMDQHLFAEFREIKMVPRALYRSLESLYKSEKGNPFDTREFSDWKREQWQEQWQEPGSERRRSIIHALIEKIPSEFTLNKGHVMFFYDKGRYLYLRYYYIRFELYRRGMNFDVTSQFDPDQVYATFQELNNDYTPTPEALTVIRARIEEKIAMKPEWYRYGGVPSTRLTQLPQ